MRSWHDDAPTEGKKKFSFTIQEKSVSNNDCHFVAFPVKQPLFVQKNIKWSYPFSNGKPFLIFLILMPEQFIKFITLITRICCFIFLCVAFQNIYGVIISRIFISNITWTEHFHPSLYHIFLINSWTTLVFTGSTSPKRTDTDTKMHCPDSAGRILLVAPLCSLLLPKFHCYDQVSIRSLLSSYFVPSCSTAAIFMRTSLMLEHSLCVCNICSLVLLFVTFALNTWI